MQTKTKNRFPTKPFMEPFYQCKPTDYLHNSRRLEYVFSSNMDRSTIDYMRGISGFSRCVEAVADLGVSWILEFINDFHTTQYTKESKYLTAEEISLAKSATSDPDEYFTILLCLRVPAVMSFLEMCTDNGYDRSFNELIDLNDSSMPWFRSVLGYKIIEEANVMAKVFDEEKSIMEASRNGEENENTERMYQEQPIHRKASSL